jgi:hypothetical protein
MDRYQLSSLSLSNDELVEDSIITIPGHLGIKSFLKGYNSNILYTRKQDSRLFRILESTNEDRPSSIPGPLFSMIIILICDCS